MTILPAHSDEPTAPAQAEISRLRDLALLDELTGLPNRRAFIERMEDAFLRADAGGPAFSLVLLDMDGLKDINDTFGYQAGNRALQEFAAALAGTVRSADLVARIGGDEFAILAEHPTIADATPLFERLRTAAHGVVRSLRRGGPRVILSAALGQGTWSASCRSVDDVFTTAEGELVMAKGAPPAPGAPGVFRPRGRRALGEELRSLLGMARQVATSTGITELLHHVVEQAAALVGVECAALALVHEDGMVRFDEVWRNGAWQLFQSVRPLDMGVLGRTAARGMPEWHNTQTPELHHDHATIVALDIRSLLCVPLRDRQGTTFGVLALGNKRGVQEFQQNDVGLAQAFADLAASAIENVRSFDATEEARAYQRALMEQAHDAILVADPVSGRLVDVNLAMERLSGYTHDDLLRLTIDDLGLGSAILGSVTDDGPASDLPCVPVEGIRRKDGAHVAVELSASFVQTQRGPRLLVIVRNIEDRIAAEAEMRRRNEELEARNAVAALLTQSNGIDAALSSVLPIVVDAGELAGALVLLADEHRQLHLAASASVPASVEAALRNSPVPMDEQFAGRIAAGRRPLVINDISTLPAAWTETYAVGLGSMAMLPLVANNRTLGTLAVGSFQTGHLDEQRVARLRAFADQIAVWLDSRFSLEEAQQREQDARFVADLGESLNQKRDEQEIVRRLAEGVAGKLGGGVMVLLRDIESETWRLAASAHPDPRRAQFVEQVLATGPWSGVGVPHALLEQRTRPRLLNFAAGDRLENEPINEMIRVSGSRTLIVTPMIAGTEMLGLFAALDGGEQPGFTQRHLALAQQIAQHAAIAVANARAYRESQQSHAFLRAMMEQAGEAILVLDAASGRVVDANAAAELLTGHRHAALTGLGTDALVLERDRAMLRRTIAGLARAGRGTRRRVLRMSRADGRSLTAHVNMSYVVSGGGPAVMLLLRDVTEERTARRQRQRLLKRAREEAQRSRRLLQVAGRLTKADRPERVLRIALDACRRLVNLGRGVILLWDADARVFRFADGVGLTDDELTFLRATPLDERMTVYELAHQGEGPVLIRDAQVELAVPQEVARTLDAHAGTIVPLRAGGELLGLLAADGPVRERPFARRELAMLRGIAQQTATALAAVNARRQVEEGRDYLDAVMRHAGDGIVVTDAASGLIVDVNDRICDLVGTPRDQIIGRPPTTLIAPEQRGVAEAGFATLRAGGAQAAPVLRDLLCHDGSVIPIELNVSRTTVAGRELLVGVVRDLRGWIEAERLLARLSVANAAATQRTAELRAVADAAGILVAGGHPEVIFTALARRILDSGAYELATISLYDEERQSVCLRQVQHHLPYEPAALLAYRGQWVPRTGLPLLQRMMEDRRPLVVRAGDALWTESTVTRMIAGQDALRLMVSTPLLYHGEFVGTLSLYAREEREVPAEELRVLQALADQVAAAVHSERTTDRIEAMRHDAIMRLAQICEAWDPETGVHLRRIQAVTEALCRELGLPQEQIQEIGLASVLHDIGKIALPNRLLRKKGAFNPEEQTAIRLHTLKGEEMLAGPEFYATARQIARSHHERWDGSGYPDGLAGITIPRPARIVAVADVYDALISRRVYKPAWPSAEAAAHILENTGRHFDPEVVAAFEAVWRRDGLEQA